MPASIAPELAVMILAAHSIVILFNIFWLFAIPFGAWFGWRFVREFWWRMAHIVSMAVVAGQAAAGRACFLTVWQDRLMGTASHETPLIMRWVNKVVFWPLPLWVFAVGYIVLFLYVLAMLFVVPPSLPLARTRCS